MRSGPAEPRTHWASQRRYMVTKGCSTSGPTRGSTSASHGNRRSSPLTLTPRRTGSHDRRARSTSSASSTPTCPGRNDSASNCPTASAVARTPVVAPAPSERL